MTSAITSRTTVMTIAGPIMKIHGPSALGPKTLIRSVSKIDNPMNTVR